MFSVLLVTVILGQIGWTMAAFEEDLAKSTMLPLAAAAYSSTPQTCATNILPGSNVTLSVQTTCANGLGEWKVCSGYAGIAPDQKVIFLAYRGTSLASQLLIEGIKTVLLPMVNASIGGQASEYFYTVYQGLRDSGLNAEVVRLAAANPDYLIYVTGHSLGGALAAISAAELIKVDGIDGSRVKLITFGQPRTGNAEYASAYDSIVPYSYRVINKRDIVPQIPPRGIDGGYTHHKTEIWYASGMSAAYTECDTDEDTSCSSGQTILSVADHLTYYGEFIVVYGNTGC